MRAVISAPIRAIGTLLFNKRFEVGKAIQLVNIIYLYHSQPQRRESYIHPQSKHWEVRTSQIERQSLGLVIMVNTLQNANRKKK